MQRLLKYEFIKKSKLFLIAIITAIIFNILLGALFGEGGIAVFLSLLPLALVILYTIELIKTYSDDVNKKTGYMIFLTPNSGYSIIGSKLIFTLIVALIFFVTYILFLASNLSILVISKYSMSGFLEMFNKVIEEINILFKKSVGFNIGDILLLMFMALSSTIVFTLTVYASITLRKSIFSDIKYGGLISFIIFILLNIIIAKCSELVFNMLDINYMVYGLNIDVTKSYPSEFMFKLCMLSSAYNIVVCAILMLFSGYLLEHKINL